MENKALTQAKNTVAERHGYGNMETLLNENWTDEDIVNEVAIEYNRIMSEWVDVNDEQEAQPVLIGKLNKEFGYLNCFPVMVGTEVFSIYDRYFFNVTTLKGLNERKVFYKETLHDAIDFLPLPPAPQK